MISTDFNQLSMWDFMGFQQQNSLINVGFDSDIGFDDQIRDFMGFKQEQYGFASKHCNRPSKYLEKSWKHTHTHILLTLTYVLAWRFKVNIGS